MKEGNGSVRRTFQRLSGGRTVHMNGWLPIRLLFYWKKIRISENIGAQGRVITEGQKSHIRFALGDLETG